MTPTTTSTLPVNLGDGPFAVTTQGLVKRYGPLTALNGVDLQLPEHAVAVLLAWAPSLPGVQGLGNAAGAAGSARGVVGLSKKHMQRLLVVSQLSLSFTLLIGAGLMVRSLVNLTTLDTGIAYENVVTMQAPNTTGMPGPENLLLMDQVVDEIRQFPGVRTVAHASRAPWSPNTVLRPLTIRVEGLDPEGVVSPMVQQNFISPEYFQTVGIALVAGRGFMSMDDASSDTVVVINERMAQELFPGEDPINRRISSQNVGGTWNGWARIVGVAADTREYGLSVAGAHTIYRPAAQGIAGQSLIVSTSGESRPARASCV